MRQQSKIVVDSHPLSNTFMLFGDFFFFPLIGRLLLIFCQKSELNFCRISVEMNQKALQLTYVPRALDCPHLGLSWECSGTPTAEVPKISGCPGSFSARFQV